MSIAVSVIIPAHNEERTIRKVIEELRRALSNMSFEIIIVDDGSTDNTASALGDNVVLLRHDERRGYGAALKTGIRLSKGEKILIVDADGTYPAEKAVELINELDNCEMAVAARVGAGKLYRGDGIVRRAAKWTLFR